MSDGGPLPRFSDPPVTEVVFSLQFEQIPGLTPVHFGLWWNRDGRRDRYPLCEQQARLMPQVEEPVGHAEPFRIEFGGLPSAPAFWFLTPDRSELLQIQDDRFTRNWTKPPADAKHLYPSYNELRPKFVEDLTAFSSFVEHEGLGALQPRQVELTYINPIQPVEGVWDQLGHLDHVFNVWDNGDPTGFLPEPEHVRFEASYAIVHQGTFVGRLFATLNPVFSQEMRPVLLLQMTARGKPLAAGVDGVLGFLDLGHEWIVQGFTNLTTVPMHEKWGRTQ